MLGIYARRVLLGTLLALVVPLGTARARENVTSELVYTPAVAVVPEVRTPRGELRTYRTAQGVTYWHAGLPVYRGDHVKLNVFVSTGGADLAETRLRLDNVEKDRRTAPPWNTTLDTGDLEAGYHFVEAWARTGGDSPRAATATLVFFVDPHPAPQASAASPIVPEVPPPPGTPASPSAASTAAVPPGTEPRLEPGSGGPTVQISADNADAQKALDAGTPVVLTAPTVFTISGPGPKEGYIYALYRGGAEIHRSKVLDVGTRVKLRPDAPGAPGLLPGTVRFVVWGSDAEGRLGPPRVVEVEVPVPTHP